MIPFRNIIKRMKFIIRKSNARLRENGIRDFFTAATAFPPVAFLTSTSNDTYTDFFGLWIVLRERIKGIQSTYLVIFLHPPFFSNVIGLPLQNDDDDEKEGLQPTRYRGYTK